MASNDCNDASTTGATCANTTTPTTIMGHYELKRTLGKGNFSTVKLAQHRITHHSVAIKIVKTTVLSDDNLVKINREIDVLKKLGKHDHIVRLYQVIKTKRYFILVTEYCSSGELYDYLVEKSKLSEPKSCDYFLQILSAVEYLHDHNVVHRDIKAENLLLTNDFKTVKIADFGFANYFKHDRLLSTWCGSPPYAAPELFKGLQYVGPPVDIWSMGVILYILVCGSLPFDGHNLVYLKSRVLSGKFRIPFFMSTECESLIRGMLRLNPDKRLSIRQIRAHSWIVKHYGNESGGYKSKKETTLENSVVARNNSTVFMDTASDSNSATLNSSTNSKILGTSHKNLSDKNNMSSRGQSLDLEDDKKTMSSQNKNEDASMLCLNSSGDKSDSGLNKQLCSKQTLNCVDVDMANAVSNMSLDSNNSSMSISQILDTSNHASVASKPAQHQSADKVLSKENSMDEQILNYMVDNLKVADSFDPIRESIANDRYDDLHAMYRLLKDQPQIIHESKKSAQKFKMPSLPLMPANKQQSCKKPSITTGFLNNTGSSAYVNPISCDVKPPLTHPTSQRQYLNNSKQDGAVNLIKNINVVSKSKIDCQKSFDDRSWKVPPQLFLTPPTENITQASITDQRDSSATSGSLTRRDSELQPNNNGSPVVYVNRSEVSQITRHSFDSTVQQLDDAVARPNDYTNANHLVMSNGSLQGLWDSSILDTLGMSTPAPEFKLSNANSPNIYNVPHQGIPTQDRTFPLIQNFTGLNTNLPQIGAQSPIYSTINQNLLLAHLNSLALSAAVTQSSILSQNNPNDSSKKAPNTFVGGHNTNLVLQNNNCAPNLSLLDPNGQNLGLERRASDGQASYKSLTATNDASLRGISPEQASLNLAKAFLSSSSNQLSNQRNLGSNNSMKFSEPQPNEGAEVTSVDENNNVKQEQMNPLDLTKDSSKNNQQNYSFDVQSPTFVQQHEGKSSNQRSYSSTSTTSVIFRNYHSTTPPRRSFVASAGPQSQVSPSSISLTCGGPGHLLNRRKRHSLETESRHHHVHQQHHHHHNIYQYNQPMCYPAVPNKNNYNELIRLSKHANNTQQYLLYPNSSHIGQLRNFAMTSYKNLTKRQSSLSGWDPMASPTKQSDTLNQNLECSNQKDTR